MASIVIEGAIGDAQVRPDGTPWPLVLSAGDSAVFADEARDIIGHLLPGYLDFSDDEDGHDEALIARWESSVATASDVQALICADKAQEGLFDPAKETEDTLSALFSDKTVPVEDFETWNHDHVPLVLIATDYAPFTERPPVTGNVLWIDPSDEIAFLHSLTNLGVISFYAHDEA